MAEPEFRSRYFDDLASRELFKQFVVEIHGLDLSLWECEGYWDDDYLPFSFFLEGRLIASTCLYLLPMTVNGQVQRVAQVSSVGTLPEFRRRGLNRELTKLAMDWCKEIDVAFTFLFADDEAVPFYHACGFQPAPQHRFHLEAEPVAPREGATALDFGEPNDRKLIEELVAGRTPVSVQLGHLSFGLQMFHVLYTLRGRLTHIPELNLIVAASQEGDTLVINDLVGSEIPPFSTIQAYLPHSGIAHYEFRFSPDRLAVQPTIVEDDQDDGTHVDASFPFHGAPFRIPYTAHA